MLRMSESGVVKMTKEEALEILKNTLYSNSDLCEAVQIAIKSLEKDIKQYTCESDLCAAFGVAVKNFNENDVIFSGTRVHYELRNKTHNHQMVTPVGYQQSQEGIRTWFMENYSKIDFPSSKYVIVKVTETEKVEVVEELEV